METIVIGHRNPDMDSICSAVAYAELKRALGEKDVRAARCGALNERISFVLEKFGVAQPDFLPDVTPQVGDAMVRDYISVAPDRPVAEALDLLRQHRLRALPVVGADRKFHGVLSENKLLGLFLPHRDAAQHAREVRVSPANVAAVLGGTNLTGELSTEEETFTLMVAAMDSATFVGRLARSRPARTILFVGDREDVQHAAIAAGVKNIVATGGAAVADDVIAAARAAGTTVIASVWDTATSVFLSRGAVVARHVLEACKVSFDADRPLAAARRSAVLSNQFIFPVLDPDGRLDGILSKSDFLKPVARRLILVDHNEISQAVPGADDLPILEILDHHRLGNTPTETPILFINQPVGSTCTIVADLYARHGRQPSRQIAGLLLAGIISDTLNGTSPTATATDRAFLEELSAAAGISADDLAAEIFAVGSPLRSLSPGEVIMADAKVYEERGLKFSVSQIEEVTFSGFDAHQENLRAALRERVRREGLFFAALLLTDIKTQDSYLLAEGNAEFLRAINYPEQSEHVWLLEGVVSRKKQLLPYLTECLAAVR